MSCFCFLKCQTKNEISFRLKIRKSEQSYDDCKKFIIIIIIIIIIQYITII